MKRIEDVVVTYNHDRPTALNGILLDGIPLLEIVSGIKDDNKLAKISKQVINYILVQDSSIHNMIIEYLNAKKKETKRNFEEEVIFLYLLGGYLLEFGSDMKLARLLISRILVGADEEESCLTKVIEGILAGYYKHTYLEKIPEAIMAIVLAGSVGVLTRKIEDPSFVEKLF